VILRTESALAATEKPNTIMVGPNGLRAGWSALVFFFILAGMFLVAVYPLSWAAHHFARPNTSDITPVDGIYNVLLEVLAWITAAWVMALIEGKKILDYGYRGAFPVRRFFFGLIWGFVCASALVLALCKLGHLAFDPGMLTGVQALKFAAAWGFTFLGVGFAEESILRGYLQSTLTRGIGFWWSALVLSVGFGALHITNNGESWIGILSAGAFGLAFCLSLWYTGSLWWAIGFHAAWDWSESYFYGTADSGNISYGRRLAAHPIGRPLFSGGTAGPEGSIFALVLFLMLAAGMYFWWGRRTVSPFAGNAWKPKRAA
jgi:membrane protease YdiL (CAAX protease family)